MTRLDGYVAELEYVHNFCREFAPSSLNFVLSMQGVEPIPLEQGFSFCDLGCGQGLSTNLFASCHPEGDFHAIDFNSAHILGARSLAAKAKLENVTFWEASFDALGTLQLPEFDFIALHGVYSWVNSDNRNRIIDFIRFKLKPGGVVYISYNCLPGWAPLAPLRQLMISCAANIPGSLEGQINASVEFVGRLKAMNISYFTQNPSAAPFFDDLEKRSRNYLAHEYFNQHWNQFYHADVASELAPAGVAFAGSASFSDNLDYLNFSPEEQQLLNGIEDTVLKETVKDFAVNRQFRRDVFTKKRNRLASATGSKLVSGCRFALIVPMANIAMKHNFQRGETHFDPATFKPVLSALHERQYSLDELLQRGECSALGSEKLFHVLMVLLAAGIILPAVEPSPRAVAGSLLFNYAVLENRVLDMQPKHLSSPVVRSGIRLDWVERMLLLCELTETDDPRSFVSGMMLEHTVTKDGPGFKSRDETVNGLELQMKSFYDFQLPLLKRLRVV